MECYGWDQLFHYSGFGGLSAIKLMENEKGGKQSKFAKEWLGYPQTGMFKSWRKLSCHAKKIVMFMRSLCTMTVVSGEGMCTHLD